MATCRDCLLYPMCYAVREVGERDRYAEACGQFKNKNEYIKIKHGKWLINSDGKWLDNCYRPYCSQCKYEPRLATNDRTPYCPNCGAKMDGGKE